jgi:hypothetical protein
MTSSKILAALALFSATASAPVFSATLHRQARRRYCQVNDRISRDEVPVALRNSLNKESWKMRGYITMLVGAVFASNLLTFAAEARSQVVNNGDRFGSGAGYIGVGGRSDKRASSLRYLRYRSTSQSGYGHYKSRCYFPEEWPKLPPWPPFCN